MSENILVIGGGGREHALAWKLSNSTQVGHVYVLPGNGGTKQCGKISNVPDLKTNDFQIVGDWCVSHFVSLVVIGPEDHLANGIVDSLVARGISCFGPSAKAAQIEASKQFAKLFMDRHSIPTAKWRSFTNAADACQFVQSADFPALVIKASGLAAGKGVVVSATKDQACSAIKEMLEAKIFGTAGDTIVVEELLEGEEVSVLAFSDGTSVVCMPPAQDYKRLLDGDRGPNTGGMGCYCPSPWVSRSDLKIFQKDIIQKTIDGLRSEGMPFVGVLYAGLMLTANGPRVLEFNCRFGDPETQVLLPLLKTDLYTVIKKCCSGELSSVDVEFDRENVAVCVVLASAGYPNKFENGFKISGIKETTDFTKTLVFHAGTKMENGSLVTSGGRVLSVIAVDSSFVNAAAVAQRSASIIDYQGKIYRKDIALKAIIKKKKVPTATLR